MATTRTSDRLSRFELPPRHIVLDSDDPHSHFCPCGEPLETVQRVILNCPLHRAARLAHLLNSSLPPTHSSIFLSKAGSAARALGRARGIHLQIGKSMSGKITLRVFIRPFCFAGRTLLCIVQHAEPCKYRNSPMSTTLSPALGPVPRCNLAVFFALCWESFFPG